MRSPPIAYTKRAKSHIVGWFDKNGAAGKSIYISQNVNKAIYLSMTTLAMAISPIAMYPHWNRLVVMYNVTDTQMWLNNYKFIFPNVAFQPTYSHIFIGNNLSCIHTYNIQTFNFKVS